MEVVVTTGAMSRAKLQSNEQVCPVNSSGYSSSQIRNQRNKNMNYSYAHTCTLSLSLSLRFNGYFPGRTW